MDYGLSTPAGGAVLGLLCLHLTSTSPQPTEMGLGGPFCLRGSQGFRRINNLLAHSTSWQRHIPPLPQEASGQGPIPILQHCGLGRF